MTHFVLDKNPKIESGESTSKIIEILQSNQINSVMSYNSIIKTVFLNKIIQRTNYQIYYLDFDLLFSGYLNSDIFSKNERINLFQPTKDDFVEILKKIMNIISREKSIVILDSLNGFYNLISENKDAGRLVNCYFMMLSSIAKISKSYIFLTSLVREKKDEGFVLSVTGRHVYEPKNSTKILTEKQNSSIIVKVLGEKNRPSKTLEISLENELF